MKPADKRELAEFLMQQFRASERRSCRLLLLHRATHRYRSKAKDQRALVMRLRELAEVRRRFGYRRLHVLLKREGWQVNHKRIYRLYTQEGLSVRTRRRKKIVSHLRVVPPRPTGLNQRWSMDFVTDSLDNGRRFRTLTLVDIFSRECLILEPAFSLTGKKVAKLLQILSFDRGLPAVITVDNGSEFFSKAMDSWAYRNKVQLDFIRPGKPIENAFIESFNGKFRDECLNAEIFFSIEDAKRKIEEWMIDYNTQRPHSSIGNLTPAEFADGCQKNSTLEVKNLNLELV